MFSFQKKKKHVCICGIDALQDFTYDDGVIIFLFSIARGLRQE